MSRTWAELLGDADDGTREADERSGFLGRLRESLGKSRRALTAELAGSFDATQEEAWERLEVALIRADVGVPATAELVRRLEARGELSDLGPAACGDIGRDVSPGVATGHQGIAESRDRGSRGVPWRRGSESERDCQ